MIAQVLFPSKCQAAFQWIFKKKALKISKTVKVNFQFATNTWLFTKLILRECVRGGFTCVVHVCVAFYE